MTSVRDRDAGQDFEGNGPSSFDPRDYRLSPADFVPLSPEKEAAWAAANAQIERMIEVQRADFARRAANADDDGYPFNAEYAAGAAA